MYTGIEKYKSKRFLPFVFLFFLSIDQATKILSPSVYRNYNFAFSLPLPTAAMYTIYFLAIGYIIFFMKRNFYSLGSVSQMAWMAILSGAVSNVGERIVLGFVRDWIYVLNGVFNLADGFIILGILVLLFNPKSQYLNSK